MKHGDSKASLFHEFDVPEGIVDGWVDQVNEIGHKKKARYSDVCEVDIHVYLIAWFLQ